MNMEYRNNNTAASFITQHLWVIGLAGIAVLIYLEREKKKE